MKHIAIIAAAGALSLLLVACNGQDTKPTTEKTEVQVVTPEKAPEKAPATEKATEKAPETAPAKTE